MANVHDEVAEILRRARSIGLGVDMNRTLDAAIDHFDQAAEAEIMGDTKTKDNPADKAELERKLRERGDTKGAPVTKPSGAPVTK